jgi:hypothetical protein
MRRLLTLALSAAAFLGFSEAAVAQDANMNFFLTSVGPGNGADLGGLAGADAWCEHLAFAAGQEDKTWRAYLGQTASGGMQAVHARDRIGTGPWTNHAGVVIAQNLDQLHGENNLTKETQLSEQGNVIRGRGDTPNRHDILTGVGQDGRLVAGDTDTTCANWTSSGEGSALVGHFDRTGGGANPTSWNSAHATQGCSQQALRGTGGDGLFYCFAVPEAVQDTPVPGDD